MQVDRFVAVLKQCKSTTKTTAFFGVKARTDWQKKKWTLYRNETCDKCGRSDEQNIIVELKSGKQLTVFEAEMLFAVFKLKRKPRDYSGWHKRNAKFIDNIEKVIV